MAATPTDRPPGDLPRDGVAGGPGVIDEWVFACWLPDATLGVVSGHRVAGGRAWYWSALARAGQPLLHLAEWTVPVRSDPFIVKAHEMWAEHHCVAALEQWTIGNEAYFVALDDPDSALGDAYGTPTPTAMDLEWYAVAEPEPVEHGFTQAGVVHGDIEVLGSATLPLSEAPAVRWRRSTTQPALMPIELPSVVAHTGLRAPFAYPDGTISDWVLTPDGWRRRRPAR
jgi:hypothetical protein